MDAPAPDPLPPPQVAAVPETENSSTSTQEEVVYRTKVVQFLGRATPIVLQNDNGPCPLLAICNVLLLRNVINLGLDSHEVSQQRLLTLVADRLINSNSSVQDKEDGFANNQLQNIADAIDLLPRLATGIDVNVHFRKINDFEFTRECTIFDLLDIPLYHGWIVDPQDTETATMIGSNSYNTLVSELVALEPERSDQENRKENEIDSVDFVAATTAALGVPSPSLSRGRSFDECAVPDAIQEKRRGDIEEEEKLQSVLEMSRSETSYVVDKPELPSSSEINSSPKSEELPDLLLDVEAPTAGNGDLLATEKIEDSIEMDELHVEHSSSLVNASTSELDHMVEESEVTSVSTKLDNGFAEQSVSTKVNIATFAKDDSGEHSEKHKFVDDVIDSDPVHLPSQITLASAVVDSDGKSDPPAVSDVVTPDLNGGEPIYQGEERLLNSQSVTYENEEPVYEGEVLLAEKSDQVTSHSSKARIIKSFLENSASQLTIYGLFCLQEDLKERELCVFFRNNHFSTMFKYEGQLYLLVTDLGYVNQSDLVWEKLNEVNGDTVFVTGNFAPFTSGNVGNEQWNQSHAMASTADYLASLEDSMPYSEANSDLQLAIALQQQEFEQQQQSQRNNQQQQQQQYPQQQYSHQRPGAGAGRSGLVVGPQPPRNWNQNHPPRSEPKPKEKCTVM